VEEARVRHLKMIQRKMHRMLDHLDHTRNSIFWMGLPRCLPNFLGTRTTLGQVVSNVILFSSLRLGQIPLWPNISEGHVPQNYRPSKCLSSSGLSEQELSHHLACEPNRMETPFSCWWNGHVLQILLVYHVRSSMLIYKSEFITVRSFTITICLVRFVLKGWNLIGVLRGKCQTLKWQQGV